MPFSYHVDQFDASQDRLCPSKRAESQHWPTPTFDISVILLNQVVQVLTFPEINRFLIGFVGVEHGQSCGVSTTFIDSDHLGFAVIANSLAKKAQGGCSVPFGGQQKVDGVPCCIDRAKQILPLAYDFDVVSSIRHRPPPNVYTAGRP